jgi:hypothetical protein
MPIPARSRSWRSAACDAGSNPDSVTARLVPYVCVLATGTVIAYPATTRSSPACLTSWTSCWSSSSRGPQSTSPTTSWSATAATTSPRSSTRTGSTAGFAWRGLAAYTAGLAAEWPFVSQPDYTGALVRTLRGADISWLAGWFTAAVIYLILISSTTSTARHDQPATMTAR